MKIDNSVINTTNLTKKSDHMLYKGSVDNAAKVMKQQESERLKNAIEGNAGKTAGFDKKGAKLDVLG